MKSKKSDAGTNDSYKPKLVWFEKAASSPWTVTATVRQSQKVFVLNVSVLKVIKLSVMQSEWTDKSSLYLGAVLAEESGTKKGNKY